MKQKDDHGETGVESKSGLAWSLRDRRGVHPGWSPSIPLDPLAPWVAGVASGQCAGGFGAYPRLRLGGLKRSGHRRHWMAGILVPLGEVAVYPWVLEDLLLWTDRQGPPLDLDHPSNLKHV